MSAPLRNRFSGGAVLYARDVGVASSMSSEFIFTFSSVMGILIVSK